MVVLSFYLCMVADLRFASIAVNVQSRFWGARRFVDLERNACPLRMVLRDCATCVYRIIFRFENNWNKPDLTLQV